MLAIAHRDDVPFVITLYPGGGFRLNEPESDRQLRAVCSSPNLKKVIATQRVTRDYLLERGFCRPDQVKFIYGGVFPADRLAANHPRKLYGQNKNTFDICFVAHKYMPHGIDKGYDVFVQVAERLVNYGDIRFHVAGPFGPNDLDVSRLGEKIRFWGPQTTGFFPRFYAEMDLILAPNVPFVLFPGAFDGFPTGACIEAGIAGVGVFGTDPLNQNIAFKDGQEIVIVPRDADAIGEIICTYYRDYDRLRELCCRGQEAFRRVFDVDRQMAPRLRLLNKFSSAGAAGRQARLLAMPLPSRDVPE
jgi:glycosyltransferase involved in cell wall biosynthesis